MSDLFKRFDTVANSEAGATLHFTTPTGELAYIDEDEANPCKPLTVTMLGASSAAHKAHGIAVLRDMRKNSKKKGNKEDVISDDFFEETAAQQVKRLVAVVTGWENMCVDSAKSLPCTKENVEKVFTQYQSLRVQAINFLDNDVNFIKS